MSYQVKIPSCAFGGVGSIEKVKEVIKKEKSQKVVVFSDEGIKATGLLGILTARLDEAGVQYHVFTDCKPEPTYGQVEAVVDMVQGQECDLIIGLGGGSVMDAAKLASVLKGASYTIKDLMKDPALAEKKVKTVMIPTTCGTGSEATCNAIVAVPEEKSKKGIVNDNMIPDYVILDAQMIAKLPKSIVAATGVDALAHVVECYTSKKATPFSDPYAVEGAKLIFRTFVKHTILRTTWKQRTICFLVHTMAESLSQEVVQQQFTLCPILWAANSILHTVFPTQSCLLT